MKFLGESGRNYTGAGHILDQDLTEAMEDVIIQRYLRWKAQKYANRMYEDCVKNIVMWDSIDHEFLS